MENKNNQVLLVQHFKQFDHLKNQQQCQVCQNQIVEIETDQQIDDVDQKIKDNEQKTIGNFPTTISDELVEELKMENNQNVLKSNYINECNILKENIEQKRQCQNDRYVQTSELISKSPYRTIYRGYDNDSGCEIAWCVYPLKQLTQNEITKMSQVLDNIKNVRHQYILMCSHYYIKLDYENSDFNQSVSHTSQTQTNQDLTIKTEKLNSNQVNFPQLILVTELITAGSIREYIKQIRLPRLIVIKNWCYKILQGLEFLHKNELVHGKLTCESIYINSNNGDIKIGDLGIRQISLYNSKQSEIHQSILLKNEKKTYQYDVYCFGLVLLEMISSDVQVTNTFKYLCRLINQGFKDILINMVEEKELRDILEITLNDNPGSRQSISDLQNHQFFQQSQSDHKSIQLKPEFTILVKKVYDELHSQMAHNSSLTPSQNICPSKLSKSIEKDAIRSYGSRLYKHADDQKSKLINKCGDEDIQFAKTMSMVDWSNSQSQTQSMAQSSLLVMQMPQILNDEESQRSEAILLKEKEIVKKEQKPKFCKVNNKTQNLFNDFNLQEQPLLVNEIKKEKDITQQIKKKAVNKKERSKEFKFLVKFRLGGKKYEIDFKYDPERDNPAKIAQEMKENLHLPQEKIDAIQRQLEKLVNNNNQVEDASKKNLVNKISKEKVVYKKNIDTARIVEESKNDLTQSNFSNKETVKQKMKANIEISNSQPKKKEESFEVDDESKYELLNRSVSYRSFHEVSMGMLLPTIQSKVNQTVNYEIYNGNIMDKFNCPQNNQLVNKKEFVYSVQYPHQIFNISHIGSKQYSIKKKQQRSKKTLPIKVALSAKPLEKVKPLCLTNGGKGSLECYTTSLGAIAAITSDARDVLENENERKELRHLIETIPDIDISTFPDVNFLHQAIPEFQTYQVQYHQKQEQEHQKNIKDGTYDPHKFNDTVYEFDHNLDLLHFYGQVPNQIQHKNLPFVCDDISIILPQGIITTQNQNQQHNQSVSKQNATFVLCDQYIIEQLGQCLNSVEIHDNQQTVGFHHSLYLSTQQSIKQTTTFHFESSLAPVLEFQEQNLTETNQNYSKNINLNSSTTTAGVSKERQAIDQDRQAVQQVIQPSKHQAKKEQSQSSNWTQEFKEKVNKRSSIRKLQNQNIQQDFQIIAQSIESATESTTPITAPPLLHQIIGGTGGTQLAALQNSSNSYSHSNMTAVGNTAINLTHNTNITSQNNSLENKFI